MASTKTGAAAWRAASLIARTVYRELRRANYSRDETLRFINELLELFTNDLPPNSTPDPEAPILDAERGVLSGQATLSVLSFELARAAETKEGNLLVVFFDVTFPDWCAYEGTEAIHALVVELLARSFRGIDSVGRLSPHRYVAILPGVPEGREEVILSRIVESLSSLAANAKGLDSVRSVLRIAARLVRVDPARIDTPDAILTEGECAEPIVLFPTPAPLRPSAAPPAKRVERQPASVVVAIGGGAARAFAHAGVASVLRSNGVRIAGIAGTSNGTLVGAMLALGINEDAIVTRALEFASSSLYREMQRAFLALRNDARALRTRDVFFRTSSLALLSETRAFFIGNELLDSYLEFFVGPDRSLDSLPIPFAGCATDLASGRAVTLAHGSLFSVIRASGAVPGLFAPQIDGDRLLIDGAVLSEVPVRSASALGVSAPVLALYLERPHHHVAEYASSAEIATRANAITHAELVREQLAGAPMLLAIPVQEIGWLKFRMAKRAAEIGAAAAKADLPRLLSFLETKSEDR